MVIDYKDVTFSFKKIRQAKRLKRIRVFGIILIVILFYFLAANILESGKIKKIQNLLWENKRAEAAAQFEKIESSLFHPKTKKEIKALIHLFYEEYSQAEDILNTLGEASTSVDYKKFLNYFSDRAEYRKLRIYTDYRMKKQEKEEDLLFYKVLSGTGLFDYRQSEEAIKLMPLEPGEKNEKALALVNKTNAQLKSGKIDYIFDINGKSLAYYDTARKQTVSLAPGIVFDAFTADFEKSIKFYHLTLDLSAQEKVHRLFRDFSGSFLLFNLSDSGIAAAYSKPINKKKINTNTVFSESYEPGSILKLLTMFAYLKYPLKNSDVFPFQCKGLWQMGGKDKIFYDWMTHGKIESCKQALAVSCNLAFARIGVRVGFKELHSIFNRFYFNSGDFKDLFLGFKTGKTGDSVSTDFQLANMSVGLSEVSITTFHSALISAIISQNGSIYSPYLIMNKKNLLNLGFYNHQPRLIEIFKENAIFFKIKNAMVHVVESPGGTGRRSKVDFVKVALKTGTAGSKKLGLDAVLTGFFPADKPRYAFALRLARGGRAEWRGARFLKDFLIAFYRPRSKNK